MAPILGYWEIRGLATPIRYLLEYVGAPYVEKHYKCGPPPTFDRSAWLDEKFTLGLDLPNLPYYIDGDVKLSQSAAIMRHLARKHGLDGKTEADKMRIDMLHGQVYDFHMKYAMTVYNPKYLEMKDDYLKELPDRLKLLTSFLGERKFACGDEITWVDFVLFEFLEFQSHMVPDLLKDYPVLEQFHKRILALEAIDKYVKSSKFIKYPFNGAPAYFGGPYSDELIKSIKE